MLAEVQDIERQMHSKGRKTMLTLRQGAILGIVAVMTLMLSVIVVQNVQSQPPAVPVAAVTPPADQNYIGATACGSCHFKQLMTWKKTKHAKEAFENLPEKYKADPECLKCHSTGYGAPTGFKDIATTPKLAGTSCEACHGPGSKHEEVAKKYSTKKKLEPEEEKEVRGSIYRVLPQNVCMRCHVSQVHGEHPKYDK
jgi:hypothetical protein